MARILVTGSDGLVGSALQRAAEGSKHQWSFSRRPLGAQRFGYNLTEPSHVTALFSYAQPDYVIHTAACCGGVGFQKLYAFDLIRQNLAMDCNVIEQCVKYKVKKLLAFSSVCAMPDPRYFDHAMEGAPLREEYLHHDEPPKENWHYGYAKRMVDVLIDGAMKQHGVKNWCSVIPGGLFGPNDNYRLGVGHVVPSLIHKLYLAKRDGTALKVWGDGSGRRAFMSADDMAAILLKVLDAPEVPQRLICSTETLVSIRDLVTELCQVAGHDQVEYETAKPNSWPAIPVDASLMRSTIGDYKFTPLRESLKTAWNWFCNNYPNVRL